MIIEDPDALLIWMDTVRARDGRMYSRRFLMSANEAEELQAVGLVSNDFGLLADQDGLSAPAMAQLEAEARRDAGFEHH